MIILPAIDLKDGKAVRLEQGKADRETIYNENPVEQAKYFEDIGADYIHIIDLDGAFTGSPQNRELIKEIVDTVSTPIEVGGGIRTFQDVNDYNLEGLSRIILGTKAVEDIDFIKELIDTYGDKIAVSLDCYGNKVATRGWTDVSEQDVYELAKELEKMGLSTIIYTDISKDGMLTGPNLDVLKELNKLDLNVIASGGISSEKDLQNCSDLGLYGAITGKAIYDKRIDLERILKNKNVSEEDNSLS